MTPTLSLPLPERAGVRVNTHGFYRFLFVLCDFCGKKMEKQDAERLGSKYHNRI